jgi:hypothetical protein
MSGLREQLPTRAILLLLHIFMLFHQQVLKTSTEDCARRPASCLGGYMWRLEVASGGACCHLKFNRIASALCWHNLDRHPNWIASCCSRFFGSSCDFKLSTAFLVQLLLSLYSPLILRRYVSRFHVFYRDLLLRTVAPRCDLDCYWLTLFPRNWPVGSHSRQHCEA